MQWNYDFHSEITATTTKSNVVAVVAITPNYEIGHNLNSMKVRNLIFSRSYHFHSTITANTSNRKWSQFWDIKLIHEAIYFSVIYKMTGHFFLVLGSRALLILLYIICCTSPIYYEEMAVMAGYLMN